MTKTTIWHPFTQHAILTEMVKIARGEGAWLETPDGRRILDGISSWWVVTHGHRHPRIVQAIKDQADKLDQVIFAGHTHEPAEKLAKRLVEITPDTLQHVFLSDSGSTAVEVALKMALGYWKHTGETRERIIVMDCGYHGDTVGTMSVGERGVFNQPYEPLLFDVDTVPFPHAGQEQATLDALEAACKTGAAAAFLVEPLVQGAGGMRMYPPSVLGEMKRVCETYDTLFIADEVMTGWGRTGTLFACEQANVQPDIACYSKGITGGSMPLAVTMCRSEIYDAHYSTDRNLTFFHSSSYTGNPIACAAAVANLEIWRDEPVQERIDALGASHARRQKAFENDNRFTNIRRAGTIAAMDIKVSDEGYFSEIGPKLYAHFQSRNLLLRPLGNTVYALTPYCVTEAELDLIYDAFAEAADLFA